MKITEVSYAMKRVTRQFENDTASITIVLKKGDNVEDVIASARSLCDRALAGHGSALKVKLRSQMGTARGREALEAFLDGKPRPF